MRDIFSSELYGNLKRVNDEVFFLRCLIAPTSARSWTPQWFAETEVTEIPVSDGGPVANRPGVI